MKRNFAKYSTLAPLSVLMLTALGALGSAAIAAAENCRAFTGGDQQTRVHFAASCSAVFFCIVRTYAMIAQRSGATMG